MKKIYTPLQIAFATLIGGPAAAIYILQKNFRVLGNKSAANKTILFGLILAVVLVITVYFTPDEYQIPEYIGYVLLIIYISIPACIADSYQLKREDILKSDTYIFQPNEKVLGIAFVGWYALILIIGIPAYFIMRALEYVNLLRKNS